MKNLHFIPVRFLSLAAAFSLCAFSQARAGSLTWDASGSSPGSPTGGSGHWSTTLANWSNGTSDAAWNNTGNDIAVIGVAGSDASGTITLDEDITVGGLTFSSISASSGYTLSSASGAVLTLAPGAVISVNKSSTIHSEIAGGDLIKTGATTLILDNTGNSYTGATRIEAGTIQARSVGALAATTTVILGADGSGASATLDLYGNSAGRNHTVSGLTAVGTALTGEKVTNSRTSLATLTIDPDAAGVAAADSTFGGIIQDGSGGVALTKAGSHTFTLSGANTYTGATTVNGGTLNVSAGGQIVSAATVNDGGTFGGAGTAAAIEVNSGGSVAPGDGGIGTLTATGLTWNGGGEMKFDLSSTVGDSSSDLLALGAGVLGKGSDGTFEFDFLGTGASDNTYTLLTFDSSSGFGVGDFSYTGLASGLTGSFNLTATSLEFAVVPEPAAWAMLLGGVGLLLGFRRFRFGAS